MLLLHGDCLQVMRDLSANSIDLFVCDLPYGCLTGGGKEKAKRGEGNVIGGCSWDIPLDLAEFWKQVKRLAKDEHTPVLMFCTTKFGAELINSNPSWFRYDLVWDKGRGVSFLSANKMPMRSHEMIYVFSKAGAYYTRIDISGNFPQGGGGGRKNAKVYGTVGQAHITPAGRRCVKSVIQTSDTAKLPGKHPTEKPIDLYKWLITRYSPAGGTILDPTAGSFNSCFAAEALGRKAIGIEKDETFFKKAKAKADGPRDLSVPPNP